MTSRPVVGRYAPSPSGLHHLGNLRSAVLAWVDARAHGGACALRIDDLDQPRLKAGSEEQIREELAWIGLKFAPMPSGPRQPGESAAPAHEACRQVDRTGRYREALTQLIEAGAVYPCSLSGRAFAQALRAPHAGETDRVRLSPAERDEQWRLYAQGDAGAWSWRFASVDEVVSYRDEAYGLQSTQEHGLDDFVVWRRDGLPSYQLATVVDDHDLSVQRVVRGADLIESTLRQVSLLRALGWAEPAYRHLSLVQSKGGERLSKRNQGLAAASLRAQGVGASELLGWIEQTITGRWRGPVASPEALLERVGGLGWPVEPVCVPDALHA